MRTGLMFVLTMLLSLPVTAGAQGEQQSADIAAPDQQTKAIGKLLLMCTPGGYHVIEGNKITVYNTPAGITTNPKDTAEVMLPVGEYVVVLTPGDPKDPGEKHTVRANEVEKVDLCGMRDLAAAASHAKSKDPNVVAEKPLPYWALGVLLGAPGVVIAVIPPVVAVVYGVGAFLNWSRVDQKAASDGLSAKSSYRKNAEMARNTDFGIAALIGLGGLALTVVVSIIAAGLGAGIGFGIQETVIGMNQKEPPPVGPPPGPLSEPPSTDGIQEAPVPQPEAK